MYREARDIHLSLGRDFEEKKAALKNAALREAELKADILKQLDAMDVRSPGNIGWETRLLTMLEEFSRQSD
jgi:hypothetical protein